MSSPAAAVSLVPQAKKVKKKRPGFRPVGKSTNKTASKNAASKKKPAPVTPASKNIHPSSPGAAAAKDPSTTEDSSPQASSPRTALKSATTRKRKSHGISVGFSIQDDANKQTTEQESPSKTSEPAATAIPTPTTAAVATLEPSKDKDILQQLQAEDPDGVRLSSFCTTFKGKKTKLPRGQPRPERNNNNNNNDPPTQQQQQQRTRRDHEPESSTGAPIVQIIDGEIVLQEASIEAPGARRSVQQVEEEFDQVVEEDAGLTIVGASYNSFKEGRNKGPQHWTVKETKLFYEALRQLGTDFGSMEAFFDDRTRKQLKRKFRSESVKNPKLIEMALDPKYQKEIDLSVFNVTVDPERIEAAANEEPPEYEPTDPEPPNGAEKASDVQEMGDVVEEDAEEERRAGAPQPQASSIWADYEDEEAPAETSRRNMDEFFGIAQDEEAASAPVLEERLAEQPAPISISLVPKNASKKKKPKFRSAVRKKK